MKKDQLLMLAVAIISILCVFWAYTVPARNMALALIVNAIFSLYVCFFKLKDSEK